VVVLAVEKRVVEQLADAIEALSTPRRFGVMTSIVDQAVKSPRALAEARLARHAPSPHASAAAISQPSRVSAAWPCAYTPGQIRWRTPRVTSAEIVAPA